MLGVEGFEPQRGAGWLEPDAKAGSKVLATAAQRIAIAVQVALADAADRTTAVANGTSNTAANNAATSHTPRQQCPDPPAGDSLSPLRTNRHSDS